MPATNAPGAAFYYSNTAYLLLGLMIEAVTGRSWATEPARSEVFVPAGMRDFDGAAVRPEPQRLSSYHLDGGTLVDVTGGRLVAARRKTAWSRRPRT